MQISLKGAQNLGPFQYSDAEAAQLMQVRSCSRTFLAQMGSGRDYFIRVVYGARGFAGSRCVCITACAYNRYHLRFRIRPLRWQGRYGLMGIVDIILFICRIRCSSFYSQLIINEVLTPVIKVPSAFKDSVSTLHFS